MTEQSVFAGLKVVEIASFIAAPAAATMLADLGADVIKVEPPGTGDPPAIPEFAAAEPGRGRQLQLASGQPQQARHGAGPEIRRRNQHPATSGAVGRCRHHQLPARHAGGPAPRVRRSGVLDPRVIYADITGFGDAGADANLPGFDLTAYWSRSGLLASTRDAGAPPTAPVWGSGDYTTAVAIYAAITTALYQRKRTGHGANVGTSLLAMGVWATGTLVSAALAGGTQYQLHDRTAPVNALSNPYRCADGHWLMLVARPQHWAALVAAIERPDLLTDSRFADEAGRRSNAAELAEILDGVFAGQPVGHWKQVLDEARITYGAIQTPEEAAADPQLRAAEIVVPIVDAPGLEYTVSSPITIRGQGKVPARRAPEHGEHNAEILKELGFTDTEISTLQSEAALS